MDAEQPSAPGAEEGPEAAPAEPQVATPAWKRVLRVLLGVTAGGLVTGFAAWRMGVDPHEVGRFLADVPPWTLGFCLASAFVELGFQALRWHLVMSPLLGLGYGQAYRAQVVGGMFNFFVPARGGDFLRVQYLGRRTGKSRAVILGTEVVDRWLDYWGIVYLLLVVSVIGDLPRYMYFAGGLFSLLVVSTGALLTVLTHRGWTPKQGSRLSAIYAAFQSGMTAFRSRRTLTLALTVAPVPWLWEIVALMIASRGFGFSLSFLQAFCVLVGFNIAMVLPTPGAIGTTELAGTWVLTQFGVERSRAFAFMSIYHLTQLLPSILAGVGILVFEGERLFGGARQAAPHAPPPPP